MTAKTDNARTQKAMRRRAAERRAKHPDCSTCGRFTTLSIPLCCSCGFSTLCAHCANNHQCQRAAGKTQMIPPDPIVLPADKDRLARWQGDHAALLARLQESFAALWLLDDVLREDSDTDGNIEHYEVGKIIAAAVKHFEEMPR